MIEKEITSMSIESLFAVSFKTKGKKKDQKAHEIEFDYLKATEDGSTATFCFNVDDRTVVVDLDHAIFSSLLHAFYSCDRTMFFQRQVLHAKTHQTHHRYTKGMKDKDTAGKQLEELADGLKQRQAEHQKILAKAAKEKSQQGSKSKVVGYKKRPASKNGKAHSTKRT